MAGIEDEFDGFFDELSRLKPDEQPATTFGAAADGTTPVVETPVVETPVVETPVVETPVVAEGDKAAPAGEGEGDGTKVETPVVTAPDPKASEAPPQWLERLADVLDKRQPPAPAPQPRPRAQPAPIYSGEELTELQTFAKDWPDIARAFELYTRGQRVQDRAAIYEDVARVVSPLQGGVQTVQVNQQLNDLQRAIPDYDQVRDPVINWVRTDKTLPPYLRSAYNNVIEGGEVGEVAHLVGEWRKATGSAAPAVRTTPAVTVTKANELAPAVKQAAASLAPVQSQRTVHVPSAPSGFDDAFEAFAKD